MNLVRKMRASFLILGPLLAKIWRGRSFSCLAGVQLGTRPVDTCILDGLEKMGVAIFKLKDGYVVTGRV